MREMFFGAVIMFIVLILVTSCASNNKRNLDGQGEDSLVISVWEEGNYGAKDFNNHDRFHR